MNELYLIPNLNIILNLNVFNFSFKIFQPAQLKSTHINLFE